MNNLNSLKQHFLYEIMSLIGRIFFSHKPKLNINNNYLNLGCGDIVKHGYINANFFYGFKFLRKDKRELEWQLDLRYPLKCKDETFDGVFTEHTLEHLYPYHVESLLKELYRVMKKGAVIRITVPDLEKYINYSYGDFSKINSDEFSKRFHSPCAAMKNISQNYLHLSLWDFEEMKLYLESAGFKNVKKVEFMEGCNEKLLLDIEARKWETLYVEAEK